MIIQPESEISSHITLMSVIVSFFTLDIFTEVVVGNSLGLKLAVKLTIICLLTLMIFSSCSKLAGLA